MNIKVKIVPSTHANRGISRKAQLEGAPKLFNKGEQSKLEVVLEWSKYEPTKGALTAST